MVLDVLRREVRPGRVPQRIVAVHIDMQWIPVEFKTGFRICVALPPPPPTYELTVCQPAAAAAATPTGIYSRLLLTRRRPGMSLTSGQALWPMPSHLQQPVSHRNR